MKVIFYVSQSGQHPIEAFLASLNSRQEAKLLRIVTNIETYGLNSVIPHLKKLSGTPLWEIKVLGQDNIRFLYAVPLGQYVLILHGFNKKTQKTPQKEINIAVKRLESWPK